MPTLKVEPRVAARLIDLLSTDDGYRERFMTDMVTALRDIGHIADVAELDAFAKRCLLGVTLADKEVIVSARDEIQKMLTRGGNYSVPALDANLAANRPLLASLAHTNAA